MCGITGVFAPNDKLQDSEKEQALNAASLISHRGPDHLGYWEDENIFITHNKLSILDFSESSNQPILSNNVVSVFNGEIYNFEELKIKYTFPDKFIDSDVINALYQKNGINFIEEIEGDFAIALYDKSSKRLFLIRDRLGVKPLVYHTSNGKIYFSSEAKTFNAFSAVKLEPNIDKIVTDLLMWFWADKEETYFKDVINIKAGEYIVIDSKGLIKNIYWDIPFNKYPTVTEDQIKNALEVSTQSRLQGEAKFATLLSGGLDSSLLTAMIAKKSKPLTSYTIKYDDGENNNDFEFATQLASTYPNINHRINLIPKKDITIKTVDTITYYLEEVMWDKVYYSMFINYLTASQDGFRIIINGQGSDEVWLGYYHDFPHYKFKESQLSSSYLTQYFILENIKDIKILSERYRDISH